MGAKLEKAEDVVRRAFAGLLVTGRLTQIQVSIYSLLSRSLLLTESEKLFRKVDARPA